MLLEKRAGMIAGGAVVARLSEDRDRPEPY